MFSVLEGAPCGGETACSARPASSPRRFGFFQHGAASSSWFLSMLVGGEIPLCCSHRVDTGTPSSYELPRMIRGGSCVLSVEGGDIADDLLRTYPGSTNTGAHTHLTLKMSISRRAAMYLGRDGGCDIRVEDVVDIARAAGRAIMDVYMNPETWDSRSKPDETPVTKADILADELIRTRLHKAYPDIPIISEESDNLPYEERRNFEYCWVVDPLDGTKEFIKRTGDFAVMIGLCLRGSPVLGVVHAPAQKTPKTHYAVAGKGAFVLPGDACGEGLGGSARISARSFGPHDSGLRLAVSSSRPPKAFIAACDSPVTCSIGSAALKAIAVADGTADVFPCLYSTSEWDTCAAHVIVEEAGGFVLRYDGSGERGMADIAPLLEGAAGASEDAEGSRVGDLRLTYNKTDLSSPHCLFGGRCQAI